MDKEAQPAGAHVQSVDRALRLVEILAGRRVAGVTELAHAIGVHKSTASRLLATLDLHGIVEQDPGHGGYRLGWGLIHLADGASGHARLLRASHPVTERLAHEVGEVVNVAVLDGDVIVDIDQVIADPAADPRDWTGRLTPLHATAGGKVLLAWLPEDQAVKLLGHHLTRFTGATRTQVGALLEELAEVRSQGWAITVDELEIGLTAVSAPIFAANGETMATLAVSGPSARLVPERAAAVAALTAERAGEISLSLGYPGWPSPDGDRSTS
ncbi:MAG: IclR family transcriptional regulator [Acidimicrobiales bacterium]